MWLHTPTLGRNSECFVKAFRFCLVSAFSVLRRDGTWWWHMMTRSTGKRENYCFALSVLQPCFRWLEAWQPGADRPRALEAFGLWPLYPCGFWGRDFFKPGEAWGSEAWVLFGHCRSIFSRLITTAPIRVCLFKKSQALVPHRQPYGIRRQTLQQQNHHNININMR